MRKLITVVAVGSLLAACSSPAAEETAQVAPPPPQAGAAAPSATPAPAWAGTWSYRENFAASTLTITGRGAAADGFDFVLEAVDGAHTGELSGWARVGQGGARYISAGPDEEPCTLLFRLNADSTLTVEQPAGTCGAGAGVSYAGTYVQQSRSGPPQARAEPTLPSLGVLHNAQEDAAFRRLVGADYRRFTASAQLVSEDTTAEFPNATVYDSYVRGLGSVLQHIIVVDGPRNLWAAVVAGDSVLYYTSRPEYAHRLPAKLVYWHAAMGPEKTVVYQSARP